jgi:hypothetical protein
VPAPESSDIVERLREMHSRGLTLADIISQWEGTDKDNGKRRREAKSNDTSPKARNDVRPSKAGRVPADTIPDVYDVSSRPLVSKTTPIKPLLVSRRQASEVLNCGYRSVDALIKRGELISKKIGWRVMVTLSSLEAWMGEPVCLDHRPVRSDVGVQRRERVLKAPRETAGD